MNPAFAILVVLGTIALWFLASGIFKVLGRFIFRIGSDAASAMSEEIEDNEEKGDSEE